MPGGTLDVPTLWVTEPKEAETPAEAIPEGHEFTLHALLTGSGNQWDNMKAEGHEFEIYFHMEGIGKTEEEVDYGPETVTLNENQNEYEVSHRVPADENTLPIGLYRVGCTAENMDWPGAVGFIEGLVLQIYKARKAQPQKKPI
jgi:hypothetical protein